MQYTETELNKLIETVEKEFSGFLNKAEEAHKATLSKSEGADVQAAPLAKAEDKPADKKDAAPEKKDAAPEKKEGEDKPADQKDAAPAPKEGEAPEAKEGEAPAAAAPAEGQAAPAEGEAHGYDAEDMEHMQKMYASMSKAELKAHHDCIAALAKGGMAKCGEMAPAKAPAAEMGKSEPKSHEEANGGQINAGGEPKGSPGAQSPASKDQGNLTDMEKSEKEAFELAKSENEALKAEVANLKKTQETVQEFLTKLVKKVPAGKAITEVAALAKSEGEQTQELSKSEVNAKLLAKSSDPKLSKADREAINAFYLNKADINTISHLLKN